MRIHTRPTLIHQRGAVLFIALILMVLITLLALTATSSSILQEKMTGGMRNSQLSMMGAESAVRGTEAWLWNLSFSAADGQPLPPCIGGSTGTCVYRVKADGTLPSNVQAFRSSKAWVTAPGGAPAYSQVLTGLTGDSETASLASQPEVLVEDLGKNMPPGAGGQAGVIDSERGTGPGNYSFYRITARSQGGSAATQRVVESVFTSIDLTNTGIEP